MTFYNTLGFLVFGSRLRRLSEYFIAEINKVYQDKGIDFDASWFPIFYVLSKQNAIALVDIAAQLQTSHSAVSQLITNLRKKGFLELVKAKNDGRKQLVVLNAAGKQVLEEIKPIWEAIDACMNGLTEEDASIAEVLPAIHGMETVFKTTPLSQRILKNIKLPNNQL